MNELDNLKRLLNEDGLMSESFRVELDSIPIVLNCSLVYNQDSKLELNVEYELKPSESKTYVSETAYSELSEDQFRGSVNKLKSALEDVLNSTELMINNKTASYGLKENL
jgi:hypothetical protein